MVYAKVYTKRRKGPRTEPCDTSTSISGVGGVGRWTCQEMSLGEQVSPDGQDISVPVVC